MSFQSLGLSKSLLKTLESQGYITPYPIQEQAIKPILYGKDVLGIAPTGSGKTASYVLPLLQILHGKTVDANRYVQALILVPTRELAMQVQEVVRSFSLGYEVPLRSLAVYGGVSINPQMKALRGVQILIATPGRLIELVESNAVHLDKIKTLVLDEADKMLNLGFKKEMNTIFGMLPKLRQNLLFSATLSKDLDGIHEMLLMYPEVIKIEPTHGPNVDTTEPKEKKEINDTPELNTTKTASDLINQLGYFVSEDKKGPLLRYIIKEGQMKQALVFVSSQYKADNVAEKLRKNGVDALAMHGNKSHSARKDALSKFKAGHLNVLVSTDLLSRGIDIEYLPYVINYELPRSPKDFVHRIGRTGRADHSGEAITFVTPDDLHHFKVIQKKINRRITMIDSDKLNIHGY